MVLAVRQHCHFLKDDIIVDLVNQIVAFIASIPSGSLPGSFQLTFFELVTLLAFLCFRATKCRFAIIETGIGGRLDATNIIQSSACLLTPIDLEHTDVLGNTIESIAREKSGIIKPGVPVFSSGQVSEVKNIFHGTFDKQESQIFFLNEKIKVSVKRTKEGRGNILIPVNAISISKNPLASSMRNCIQGTVSQITDNNDSVILKVLAGELFEVKITKKSFTEMGLGPGIKVYLNFKSTAVEIL